MKIGLFIPCYVDALYPEVGKATYKLLCHLGLDVTYPERQTCCGQPMSNAGFEPMARHLANNFEDMFSGFDYVVAPSASCAAFVRFNYPRLLPKDHECVTPKNTMDIVEFLHDVVKVKSLPGSFPHVVSVHNSCHGVRELGLSSPSERNIPRYNKIIDLLQLNMGENKIERHMATGAEYVTGPDSSCLMHMEGIARREKKPIKFIHVAQILANGI